MPERDRMGCSEDFAENIAGMHERVVLGVGRSLAKRCYQPAKTYVSPRAVAIDDSRSGRTITPAAAAARAIRDYDRSSWSRPCGEFKPRAAKVAAKWTE